MDETNNDEPIVPVPPPWKLKGTVYMLSFWSGKASAAGREGSDKARQDGLPTIAYSPLEAKSSFADPAASGEHLGGLSQIQIIRYTESPVGPYDELIICPGNFAYEKNDEEGKRKKMKDLRITRIYVSQKYTCWNGRANWNIPKHLARFEWNELPDGKASVKIYPHDTISDRLFFQATFEPVRWAPSFPLSLSWLRYVGISTALVQPPLPDGRHANSRAGEELIGTSRWCRILPGLSTRRATLGWIDMSQHDHNAASEDRDVGCKDAEYENFWPGLRRWNVAVKMENADIVFGKGLFWDPPQAGL
ncbi:hypothetical protein EV127DRAFT_513931 [Xylaria flabelliformis]|nr:hypothetical protein EV127DRAFT_513931 [Xylaria flabelliformis]